MVRFFVLVVPTQLCNHSCEILQFESESLTDFLHSEDQVINPKFTALGIYLTKQHLARDNSPSSVHEM